MNKEFEPFAGHEECANEIKRLREELDITDKLLTERNRLLEKFDCPAHGQCIPYAIEQIDKLRAENVRLNSHYLAAIKGRMDMRQGLREERKRTKKLEAKLEKK